MSDKTIDILIVEPLRDMGALVRVALADYKLKIKSVASAVEAKSALIQNIPDLVLCDFEIGDNSSAGAMLCVELSSHPNFQTLPVLLAHEGINEKVRETAAASGAVGVVSKPLEDSDLKRSVEKILGLSDFEEVRPSTEEKEEVTPPVISSESTTVTSSPVKADEEENVKAAQLILAKVLHSLKRGKALNMVELKDVPEVVLKETTKVCEQERAKLVTEDEEVSVDLSTVLIK